MLRNNELSWSDEIYAKTYLVLRDPYGAEYHPY